MKVLQILDYYLPFSTGGSEHSVYRLAVELGKEANLSLATISPEWGSSGITVFGNWYKFWMPVKGQEKNTTGGVWLTNPLFWFWSAGHIIRAIYKQKPDILHVHGKYMIPGAMIAGRFMRKPVVVTIRDYIPLCPYALCVFSGVRKHGSLRAFLFTELPMYVKKYTNDGYFAWTRSLASGLYGLIYSDMLKFCLKFASEVIYLSKAQAKIYTQSGYKKGIVIGNCVEFDPNQLKEDAQNNGRILYVGKLSYGKGVDILIKAWRLLYAVYPKWKLIICGDGQLRPWIINKISEDNLKDSVKLLGQCETTKLEQEYKEASIVVAPSIWPEPFGRVPIESLSFGTPALVTSSGGLAENIETGSTGWVVRPTIESLVKGITLAMNEKHQIRENIIKIYPQLAKRFGEDIIHSHLKLYRRLV